MNKIQEAIHYFKQNEGYKRLLIGMKNKYINLGEMKGNVVIANPTKSEKQALSGLMKKDYSKNSSITINLKKLQEILENTKFSGIKLEDLVKNYFSQNIITKKQNLQKHEDEWLLFLEELLKENENTYIHSFLKKSFEIKDNLYQSIKKYYTKEKDMQGKQRLKSEFMNACKGINHLPQEMVRIPFFASNITSNPHGFDKKRIGGRLFIMLLCYINHIDYPKNSEELSELYYNNRLLVDDASNMVLCKNIEAILKPNAMTHNAMNCQPQGNTKLNHTKDNELASQEVQANTTISAEQENSKNVRKHEGWKGFAQYNEPIFLTLYNLSKVSFIQNSNKYKIIVITENPTVFMEIMQNCEVCDFPLVCTYGQVKLAGIVLLDLLVKSGFSLYYSGDLDPEGIQIADKLKTRYKNNFNFLGFDKVTYYKNISNVCVSNSRLQKLEKIQANELKPLIEEIKHTKRVAYEEKNIHNIIEFIEENYR